MEDFSTFFCVRLFSSCLERYPLPRSCWVILVGPPEVSMGPNHEFFRAEKRLKNKQNKLDQSRSSVEARVPRGVEVNRPAFIDLDLVPFFGSSSLVGGIPGEDISLLAPAPRWNSHSSPANIDSSPKIPWINTNPARLLDAPGTGGQQDMIVIASVHHVSGFSSPHHRPWLLLFRGV